MTEAVIMLPFFFIIFSSAIYVHDIYSAKHEARERARECAWVHSKNACSGAVGCSAGSNPERVNSDDVDTQEVDSARKDAQDASSKKGGILGPVVSQLITEAVDWLIGDGVSVAAQETVKKPLWLGGGYGRVTETYHLPCNLKKREVIDIVKEVLNPFDW